MLLTLYEQNGSVKTSLSPNDSSTQDKEIQGDNVLNLSFTLFEYVSVDVNDYVDFEGERYWALEKYLPQEKSSVEWEYNLKLYGIESLIKRFLVLKTVDDSNDAVFTLTGRPIDHMRLIVQNINDGMGRTEYFKCGSVEGTDNVVIEYSGKYCDEALRELAEKVGVEWWIEGETVNLCRCEHGEEVTLGYGNGLTGIDRDVADNAKFYTRLFPIGSSRNIDPSRYGASRLRLPGGVKYVDVNTERYGIIHHFEQEAFSGIYPRRVGEVSSVRSENVTDTDGNPFTIYYFKDDDLPFNPDDYMIGGLVLHVSFQEGSELAGLGANDDHYFEVNWHNDTREFEIITIWPYDDDTQLPGGTLIPKVGDRYILWNIRMPDDFYTAAELEFQAAVNEYNTNHALDVSRYKAPTDHVWIEDEGVELYVGRRVRLESQEYFPDTGYRASRITRISRQVTLPSQMDLEISDALSTRTLEKIDDAITDVKNYTGTLMGSVNVPDIIRSWDTARPTDNNLYSARRSHKEFLSKKNADRAKKKIIFDEGLDVGDFVHGVQGGRIDGLGAAEMKSIVVRQEMTAGQVETSRVASPGFIAGSAFAGQGFGLRIDPVTGAASLDLDYLTVRHSMAVAELVIEQYRSICGALVVSAANGKVIAISQRSGPNGETIWALTLEGDANPFQCEQQGNNYAMDIILCSRFDRANNTLHRFCSVVRGAGLDGAGRPVIDLWQSTHNGSVPEVGDVIVAIGNTLTVSRQNCIVITASTNSGDACPSIDLYTGISQCSANPFAGHLQTRLGNLSGITYNGTQLSGFGLFSDSVFLRGSFALSSGTPVDEAISAAKNEAVTQANSNISSVATAIRQEFAAADGTLRSAIEAGIAAAGRNLLRATNNGTVGWSLAAAWSNAGASVSDGDNGAALISLPDNASVASVSYILWSFTLANESVKSGKHYSFAFDIINSVGNGPLEFYVALQKQDGSWKSVWTSARVTVQESDQWQRVAFHSSSGANAVFSEKTGWRIAIFNRSTVSKSLSFRNLKLEEGDISTPYSPAIEDNSALIEGLFSGGINLLRGTNQGAKNYTTPWSGNSTVNGSYSAHTYQDKYVRFYTGYEPLSGSVQFGFRCDIDGEQIVAGEQYTLSFDVGLHENSIPQRIVAQFRLDGVNNGSYIWQTSTVPRLIGGTMYLDWTHIQLTGTATHSGSTATKADLILRFPDYTVHEVVFRNLKFERGPRATAYSCAPEDIDEQFVNVRSVIEQNASSISMRVEATESNLRNVIGSPSILLSEAENITIDIDPSTGAFPAQGNGANGYFTPHRNLAQALVDGDDYTLVLSMHIGSSWQRLAIYPDGWNHGFFFPRQAEEGFSVLPASMKGRDVRLVIPFTHQASAEPSGYIAVQVAADRDSSDSDTECTLFSSALYQGRTDACNLVTTGIDIANRIIRLSSDNVKVVNNAGEQTFLLDKYGKLKTNLIRAEQLDTDHLIARDGNGNIIATVNASLSLVNNAIVASADNSGAYRIFYPNTTQPKLELLDITRTDENNEDYTTTMRMFNPDGTVAWELDTNALARGFSSPYQYQRLKLAFSASEDDSTYQTTNDINGEWFTLANISANQLKIFGAVQGYYYDCDYYGGRGGATCRDRYYVAANGNVTKTTISWGGLQPPS